MTKRSWIKAEEFKAGNIVVRFESVQNVPGYSHRVLVFVDGKQVAKDWLGDNFAPAMKHAEFYATKHVK